VVRFGLVAAALLLVGCYSPSFGEGGACTSVCPGDLECVQGTCRAADYRVDAAVEAEPDAPPGDTDADGILDNVDNCSAAGNADQHDEDGDAIGDVCDPCPHLVGTAADADADGVGDACDPQPAIGKQTIKFFDPFTTNKLEWQHGTGVTRVTDQLRAMAPTGFTRLNIATGELRIVTGGSVTAVSSSGPHQMSVSFGMNTAADDYYYAEFYDGSGSGGAVKLVKADSGTYTGLVGAAYGGALPTGAWSMQIDESVSTQKLALEATLGGLSYGPLAAPASTPALISNASLTLNTKNVDVRINYVLVIETTP
jgi:hypothetical protein